MLVHARELFAEIEFYQRQNFRLYIEDLLSKIEGGRKINQTQINENEERIERLYDCIMCID